MYKAFGLTLTALMITVFMVREGTWTDSGSTLMAAILWVAAIWMWWRWAYVRRRDREGDASDREPGPPGL